MGCRPGFIFLVGINSGDSACPLLEGGVVTGFASNCGPEAGCRLVVGFTGFPFEGGCILVLGDRSGL